MDIAIFIYNILLIMLFAAAATLSYVFYIRDKTHHKVFLVITLLCLTNVLDNTITYMTELIEWFSKQYDAQFMTIPAFKTLILLSYSFCILTICNLFLKRKTSFEQYCVFISLGLCLMFVPMLSNSALKVWLYYLPCQVYQFWLSTSSLTYLKNNPDTITGKNYDLFRKILKFTAVFSILILIEDTIVIFFVDTYSDLLVRINNRNLCEDCLSILYCIFILKFFMDSFKKEADENIPDEELNIVGTAVQSESEEEKIPDAVFESFCLKYDLTTRETEILELILENKNNQDICETLHISIGTVKTHVHNIFVKLEVTKRNQLLRVYHDFQINSLNEV